jgi:protein-tyrosine phosphatase
MSKIILLVCTGNIFRSLVAEHAVKSLAGSNEFIITSAGIDAEPRSVSPIVVDLMRKRGIDLSEYRPTKVNQQMLVTTDLTVAMSFQHQTYLEKVFNHRSVLFSTVCNGKELAIPDLGEALPNWRELEEVKIRDFADRTISQIFGWAPLFLQNVNNFI